MLPLSSLFVVALLAQASMASPVVEQDPESEFTVPALNYPNAGANATLSILAEINKVSGMVADSKAKDELVLLSHHTSGNFLGARWDKNSFRIETVPSFQLQTSTLTGTSTYALWAVNGVSGSGPGLGCRQSIALALPDTFCGKNDFFYCMVPGLLNPKLPRDLTVSLVDCAHPPPGVPNGFRVERATAVSSFTNEFVKLHVDVPGYDNWCVAIKAGQQTAVYTSCDDPDAVFAPQRRKLEFAFDNGYMQVGTSAAKAHNVFSKQIQPIQGTVIPQ